MSKAVLILDEMPENCGWCKLCDRLSTCMPTGYTTPAQDLDEDRPDWCPFHELPDKQETLDDIDYDAGFIDGWNTCIDKISGKDVQE